MHMVLRRLFCVLLIFALTPFAFANVVESFDWLVRGSQHKWLDTLQGEFGTPNTEMPEGMAVVAIELGGDRMQVLVIGPVSGNARKYADAIDQWRQRIGLKGDVLFSQENDCAAATYSFQTNKLWATSTEIRVNLRALFQYLTPLEKSVSLTLRVRQTSKIDGLPDPNYTSTSGIRYWKFEQSDTAPTEVTARITAGPNDGIFAMIWLGFMPVVNWILAPLSWFVSVRFGSNIREKREAYRKALMYGVFGSIVFHAIWSMFVLFNRTFDPIAQVWFAERFSAVAIPVVLLGLPIGIFPLFLLSKWEKKLFGPAEDEVVIDAPKVIESIDPEGEKQRKKLKVWIKVGFLIAAMPFYFMSSWLPKGVPIREVGGLIGVCLAFILPDLITMVLDRKRAKVVESNPKIIELEARLQSRGSEVNKLMNSSAKFRIGTSAIMGMGAYAGFSGVVTVGANLMELLADEELDFILAHEVAHIKLSHPRRRILIGAVPLLLTLPVMIFLSLTNNTRGVVVAMLFTFPLMLLSIPLMSRLNKMQEFQCDQLAITTLRNKDAAKSALKKSTAASTMPGVHSIDSETHPSIQRRLKAIDEIVI